MSDRIIVAIPTYHCEAQIGRVISQLDAKLRRFCQELLIIDNGSRDGTIPCAIAALQSVPTLNATVLRNRDNYNLGGSTKIAFNYCLDHGATHCILLHGDDQADLHDLLPWLESGRFRSYDCLLGSRFSRRSHRSGYSGYRLIGNKSLNLILSAITGHRVVDLGSGLNMYAARFLSGREYLQYPNSLTFGVYTLFLAWRPGFRTKFFPIHWREEDQISNARPIAQAMSIIAMALQFRLSPETVWVRQTNAYSQQVYESEAIWRRNSCDHGKETNQNR